MIYSRLLGTAAFTSSVLAYGTILSPQHRSSVGSAAQTACGNDIAAYLAANPGADLKDVEAHQGAGFDSAACNIQWCSGYQYADNTGNVITLAPNEALNITVKYSIPPGTGIPEGSDEYYELYAPMLNLVNASSGYPLGTMFQYNLTPDAPEVLKWPGLAVYYEGDGELPPGTCGAPGECFISWQLYNFFRSPRLVSWRILDSA